MQKRPKKLDEKSIQVKYQLLKAYISRLESLAISYSGGVDSTLLLAVSHEILDQNTLAVTANSPIHPTFELEIAQNFTGSKGIRHIIFPSSEMDDPQFLANTPERCYYCKLKMLQQLKKIAQRETIQHIAHGANMDDLGDYRPGLKAAKEMKILSPFVEVGLIKDEIRYLSKKLGLPTWDRPSMACLATRVPYGQPITPQKLEMINNAETYLRTQGLREIRVRHYGDLAIIEVGSKELDKIIRPGMREQIVQHFKSIGFLYVSLDMEGYLSGKMNRSILKEK